MDVMKQEAALLFLSGGVTGLMDGLLSSHTSNKSFCSDNVQVDQSSQASAAVLGVNEEKISDKESL